MEFLPVEIEEVKSIFSIAKSTVDVITRLYHQYKESDNDESGENGDRKDCIKEAMLTLRNEMEAKKIPYLENFVEKTLLTPECELEPATIYYFLKEIEQMTWRQLCLLEGFRREDNREIEISGSRDSDLNGISIGTEVKKIIDLNYLYERSSSSNRRNVTELGIEISKLLDLESIDLPEIGKAFGEGRIKTTVTY